MACQVSRVMTVPAFPQVAALWLSLGGRGLDTARSYHNQDQVGAAIRESGLDRSSVFITTKIACAGNASGAAAMIDGDLKMLGYPSVDLLLIHRPNSYPGHPEQCHDPAMIAATWKAMEAAKAAGKARAIGVSNFNSSQLAALREWHAALRFAHRLLLFLLPVNPACRRLAAVDTAVTPPVVIAVGETGILLLDIPSASLLKHLLKGEGGAAE